jgi:hypothetical protein
MHGRNGDRVWSLSMVEELVVRRSLSCNLCSQIKGYFQASLYKKMAKLKLYFSVIRPVVTYACETWILKATITHRLTGFERKILREMFGPTYENGCWQIKNQSGIRSNKI